MAGSPKRRRALDTNLPLDLAKPQDFAHEFREEFQERGYVLLLPPTVLAEIEYLIRYGSDTNRRLARVAASRIEKWRLTPFNLPDLHHVLNDNGATRGAQTNEASIVRDTWRDASVTNFSEITALDVWEKTVPEGNKPFVKVVYDRTSAEVRIVGRWKEQVFREVFSVEKGLAEAITRANQRIQDKLRL